MSIYMDGSMPVPANRALTQKLALMGHDFFEVTFLYNDGGTPRIARASWELGEPAGVGDVYRTDGGLDYYIPDRPVGNLATGLPNNNEGLVVLFVGRKSDKSLLAVGTLSHIDNGNGSVSVTASSNPLISTSTKKVSFAVNALTAGVSRAYNTADNSFKIISSTPVAPQAQAPNGDGTNLATIQFGNKYIPYYWLPVSATATAEYTFNVSAASTSYAYYEPAIRYTGGTSSNPGAECWNLSPHYTLPPDHLIESFQYQHSTGVQIDINSPNPTGSGGASFNGTVNFTIRTTVLNSSICALTFRIKVYAVYKRPTPVPGETEPVQWYLKPGYNMYYQELDSGDSENGGAVLIGIGDIGGTADRELILMGEPIKYNNVDGLEFNLKNIEIYFKNGSLGIENLTPHIIPPGSPVGTTSDDYWANNAYAAGKLRFYFDNGTPPLLGANQAPPLSALDDIAETEMENFTRPTLPYGFVKIMVVYTPDLAQTQTTYNLTFYVEVNNINGPVVIPYERRFFITKPEDFLDISNNIKSGEYLFVFAANVNIPNMTFALTGSVTIYIVATVPNIILGRKEGTDRITFDVNNASVNVTIYLGKWPFNEPAFAGGNVIIPYLFNISSGNTWGNYGAIAATNTTMFGWHVPTNFHGTMTIQTLAGVEVRHGLLGP